VVSIFSLVAALAIVGYLFTAQNGSRARQAQVSQAESQGSVAAATINFQQAAAALEQHRAETGSYAGADLAGYGGVVLARGDATTYCIQLGVDGRGFHEAGPNGAVASGPC
jgi:predicted aspartyl protease